MTASAQGIDVSAFQHPLTTTDLDGLDFAFVKATNGLATDPVFDGNWAVVKAAGKVRGAYHELVPASVASAQAQAEHLLAVVAGGGLDPGDMLACVASDYNGVTGAEVEAFCDTVQAGAPHSPVLVYSDLNFLPNLASSTGYDLWIAHPAPTAPTDLEVAPWKTWRFWQWGYRNVAGQQADADAYNGTLDELKTWIGTWSDKPPWHVIHWRVIGPETFAGAARRHGTNPERMVELAGKQGHVYDRRVEEIIDLKHWHRLLPLGTELFAPER